MKSTAYTCSSTSAKLASERRNVNQRRLKGGIGITQFFEAFIVQ
jgi:hypothetical protein